MTLLDDYEAPYKLRGISIVSEMLERVPKELLKRTGVDGLLFGVCLIFLHSSSSYYYYSLTPDTFTSL